MLPGSFAFGHPAIATSGIDACASYAGLAPPGDVRNAKFGKIVHNLMAYASSPTEFAFADKLMTFRQLKKDTTLITLGEPDDSVYQNFYAAAKISPMGKFTKVNDLINADNVTAAQSINNAVGPLTTMETNRQIVNEIYLRTFANGNRDLSTADEAALTSIAYLDPLTDGDAVYSSRSMLRIDPTTSSLHSMEALPEEEVITEANTASKIYPNPNNGLMQMDYVLSQQATGELTIFDITGRIVSSYLLSGQEGINTLQIDETKLKSGIYFYRTIINNEVTQSDKIVIVK